MSSSSNTSTPNLFQVIRNANAHYARVAATFRASLRPTHHARKRAQALQLTVSIKAASNLDQRQISTIPLPILDIDSSPTAGALVPVHASIVAPVPRYASRMEAKSEMRRPARPALRCAIPAQAVIITEAQSTLKSCSVYSSVTLTPSSTVLAPGVLRGKDVPWRGPTSRWSATTIGDMDENEDEQDIADQDTEGNAEDDEMYSSDYDESMDLPVSPDREGDDALDSLRPRISIIGTSRARISMPAEAQQPRVRPPLPTRIPREHTKVSRSPPRLDVPVDMARMSWCSDMLIGPNSGSSAGYSSNGPITPVTSEDKPKLTIRIKRKSDECDIEMEDNIHENVILEKRPKYERKPWVVPATQRRGHQRTASSSSGRFF